MAIISWLHLSDTHFWHDDPERDKHELMLKALKRCLLDHFEPLACTKLLFLTGDLTEDGGPESFKLAKEYISDLRSSLGVKPKNVFLTPGNHDLCNDNLDKDEILKPKDYQTARRVVDDLGKGKGPNIYSARLKPFIDTVRELREDTTSKDEDFLWGIQQGSDLPGNLQVVVLCSSALSIGKMPNVQKDETNSMCVGSYNLNKVANPRKPASHLSIGIVHHTPFPWLYADDASEFNSIRNEFEYILYGHHHHSRSSESGEYKAAEFEGGCLRQPHKPGSDYTQNYAPSFWWVTVDTDKQKEFRARLSYWLGEFIFTTKEDQEYPHSLAYRRMIRKVKPTGGASQMWEAAGLPSSTILAMVKLPEPSTKRVKWERRGDGVLCGFTRGDRLYFGTDKGVCYADAGKGGLKKIGHLDACVRASCAKGEELYLATDKGVLRYSGQTLEPQSVFVSGGIPTAITITQDEVWLARAWEPLICYNLNTKLWKPLNTDKSRSAPLVLSLHTGKNGKIFAGTQNGLGEVDPNTGRITMLGYGPKCEIHQINQSDDDDLWLATSKGLYAGNEEAGFKPRYEKPVYAMAALGEDVWLASTECLVLEGSNGTEIAYDPAIKPKTVTCLLIEGPGKLWLGTREGLRSCSAGRTADSSAA